MPVEHATYETLHQLGENFEEFKKDKTKTLVVACKHSKENNQVEITSESTQNEKISIMLMHAHRYAINWKWKISDCRIRLIKDHVLTPRISESL